MKRFVPIICLLIGVVATPLLYADDKPTASTADVKTTDVTKAPSSDPAPATVKPAQPPAAPKSADKQATTENQKTKSETTDEPSLTKTGANTAKPVVDYLKQIFQKPSPSSAIQDPRVLSALDSTRSMEHALSVIHERFRTINDSYELRQSTNTDLKAVIAEMKPLVKAARTDVMYIMQSAQDMMAELPHNKLSLEATAKLYRQKAITYRDPALRKITEAVADEMERLENDVPRKMRLTADFILELTNVHSFLAETDRCLNDTATAMQILTAGNDEPKGSIEGIAFRIRVKQYMTILDEYGKKLGTIPEPEEAKEPSDSDKKSDSSESKEDKLPGNPASSEKKKTEAEVADAKPNDTRLVPTSTSRDIFQPHTSLKGSYIDPTGVLPLQVNVRFRTGNQVSGDIVVTTAYGPGVQRFSGTVNEHTFSLHVTYVSGPLLENPETWEGRFHEENISGTWKSVLADGEFVLDYNPPKANTSK